MSSKLSTLQQFEKDHSKEVTIAYDKHKEDEWRSDFENYPKAFYGGNNLQRDGHGYDSSYVNSKWDIFLEVRRTLQVEIKKLKEALAMADQMLNKAYVFIDYNRDVLSPIMLAWLDDFEARLNGQKELK